MRDKWYKLLYACVNACFKTNAWKSRKMRDTWQAWVSNRSMNNVWNLLKLRQKDTRTTFLLLTLNKFHTSSGQLKWYYGGYLYKFFWLKLYSQYLLRCIMYFFTKILQGGEQLVGLSFTKGALEFVVKILDKYTYEEFLKTPFKNWNCKFEDISK